MAVNSSIVKKSQKIVVFQKNCILFCFKNVSFTLSDVLKGGRTSDCHLNSCGNQAVTVRVCQENSGALFRQNKTEVHF